MTMRVRIILAVVLGLAVGLPIGLSIGSTDDTTLLYVMSGLALGAAVLFNVVNRRRQLEKLGQ